ncbi:MAG: hypothetical protein ACREBT_04700 [Thermoplasmata archaeon]
MPQPQSADSYNPYLGWIAGGVIVLLIFAVMGSIWFWFHPL